ncbi:hypothetical protein VHEMI08602 [[Torrubiella] hemipterigena]|uniref:Uncharacterized protein n=1 Tax=[Torrubiella] hemipterigena TaxID=1531966 RepID=A0A0A1T753_9HYPO|nr:hypothetical protein VHEMI08602 [[Torrubiella] hemipterigena]
MTSSFNPFRNKMASSTAEDRFPPIESIDTSQPQPPTSFAQDVADDVAFERNDHDPQTKKKSAKKVRLVTPPPLSPDSPVWPTQQDVSTAFPAVNYESDIFGGTNTGYPPTEDNNLAKLLSERGPPANPFSKTLQDLESSQDVSEDDAEESKVGQTTKQPLNVDSFRRLLMTGKAGEDDAASTQISTQPTNDFHTGGASSSKERKLPPPPPSSRHGRTLKADTKNDTAEEQLNHIQEPAKRDEFTNDETESTDSSDDDSSEPESHHQKAISNETPLAIQTTGKKPVPAPPPRRGHGRTDTKTNISTSDNIYEPLPLDTSELKHGSNPTSTDPTPTRPESVKSPSNAPAPPPPRRPHAAPKQPLSAGPSPSISSNSVTQITSPPPSEPTMQNTETPTKLSKVGAPPPPPTRNASSRRPTSMHGTDAAGRRLTAESRNRDAAMAPPPPPPRQRGSSPHEPTYDEAASSSDHGKGADILADLDALQREVDALRGKVV